MRNRHLMTNHYSKDEYVAEIDRDIEVARKAAKEYEDIGQEESAVTMRNAVDEYLDERSRFTR
ncbi:hypothetical protein ACFYO9_37365 [Streptomyces sp. NPDC005863]|uniref:hypothetical protein n=1 Tax=Streptomyces sp. NPDC005863 TaxID=3364735 RepID=UPI00369CCFBF